MTCCPVCEKEYERIAQHWQMGSCGSPEIDAERWAIVNGLMLAGATVAGNGLNHHITIGTTTPALAVWTADELDWLCHGVRAERSGGDADFLYRIRTPAHPQLNRYERWVKLPEHSGRAPPIDFSLSRRAGRVWWAYAGGLQWSGEYASQRQGTFSARSDAKADWIGRVLADAGFASTRVGTRVQLNPSTLSRWLEWIGDPVPGAEHKWRDTQ